MEGLFLAQWAGGGDGRAPDSAEDGGDSGRKGNGTEEPPVSGEIQPLPSDESQSNFLSTAELFYFYGRES